MAVPSSVPQRAARSQAPAQVSPEHTVEALVKENSRKIMELLGEGADPKRWLRVAIQACQRQPKLLQADKVSFVAALMDCAKMKLEPSGKYGVHLVPFFNSKTQRYEVQTIVDYRGLLSLVRRSKQIKDIYTRVVREGDKFKEVAGTKPRILHEILDDTGPMTYVYAVADFINGGQQFEVMSKREVDIVRSRSKAGASGPWVTDYEQMAKKTALRRLCNTLPIEEADVQEAIRTADLEFEESSYETRSLPKQVTIDLDATIARASGPGRPRTEAPPDRPRRDVAPVAVQVPPKAEDEFEDGPPEPKEDEIAPPRAEAPPRPPEPAKPPVQAEILPQSEDFQVRSQCVDFINAYNDRRPKGSRQALLPQGFDSMTIDQLRSLREMLYKRLETLGEDA